MKDKATEWLMGLNPFDKVKGHTKIELTDVKTGKKQIIEKDNAFQAGVLASYMRSMGAYNNNPYANSTWAGQPIWRNLCGGILCFRDTIDNSEDEVEYMPAGNKMIANGAYGVANTGTPVELGSYNEIESSTSGSDSVTFVYDWGTSQGNGTISCVCLTTEIGGYIGYGNPSGASASTKKSLIANQSSASRAGVIYENARYTFTVDAGNSAVTVTRTPTEVSKGSIFDDIPETAETITYTGSPTLSGGTIYPYYLKDGKVALIQGSGSLPWERTVANNGTYSFIVVDLANKTASIKTITNTTGETLYICFNSGSDRVAVLGAGGDYIFMYSTTYKVYAINLNTSAATLLHTMSTFQTGKQFAGALSDGLYIARKDYNSYTEIFDSENGTVYPTNSAEGNNSNLPIYNGSIDAMTMSAVYKNPLILATVNNLDNPVTKTAAQTMKITYTLSKAEEE